MGLMFCALDKMEEATDDVMLLVEKEDAKEPEEREAEDRLFPGGLTEKLVMGAMLVAEDVEETVEEDMTAMVLLCCWLRGEGPCWDMPMPAAGSPGDLEWLMARGLEGTLLGALILMSKEESLLSGTLAGPRGGGGG